MATQYANGKLVTNGLVYLLDIADINSYRSGSTIIKDLSGNRYDTTLYNSPAYSSSYGGGIDFDGTNTYCQSSTTATYHPNAGITCELIFSIPNIAQAGSNAIFTHDNGGNNGWFLSLDSVIPNQLFFTLGSVAGYASGLTIAQNTITHVACTISGNDLTFYKNGQFGASATIATYGASAANYFIIGRVNFGSLANTLMTLYNARVYNRALSSREILQNYNAQKGRFNLK